MKRYSARSDENQPAIVAALRKAGAFVRVCSDVGRGFPDLFVAHQGRALLIEIKNPAKPIADQRLKPDQVEFHAQCAMHGVTVHVVYSPDGALAVLGQHGA